jgi:hypothetical protein
MEIGVDLRLKNFQQIYKISADFRHDHHQKTGIHINSQPEVSVVKDPTTELEN